MAVGTSKRDARPKLINLRITFHPTFLNVGSEYELSRQIAVLCTRLTTVHSSESADGDVAASVEKLRSET